MRHQRPRLARRAYEQGLGCLLTFCTANRQRVFVDDHVVVLVLTNILRAAAGTRMSISAYCFMPDHLHLVVEGSADGGDVCDFVKQAKQLSAFYCRLETGRALWQPSWHDRVIRKADDRLAAIRYVLENPIRAGLVSRLEDYQYLGSGVVSRAALLASIG